MITDDILFFPQNVVTLVAENMKRIDEDLEVFRRPLRESDPTQSIGVFGAQWAPDEDSYEMRGGPAGRHEPTIQQYTLGVQAFIIDMDEDRGLAVHSVLAKLVRTMLLSDPDLHVGLAGLVTTIGGTTERAARWGVRPQRLISNELSGSWIYLSTLEFWLDTHTETI